MTDTVTILLELYWLFLPLPYNRYDSNASASDSSEEGDSEDESAKKKAKKVKVVKEKKERKPRKEVRITPEHCKIVTQLVNLKPSPNASLLFSFGLEKAERHWWPQEANECLHAVAQLQPWADQVGEPRDLRHRDIQEGWRDVEAAGQGGEGGEARRLPIAKAATFQFVLPSVSGLSFFS